MKNTSDNGSSKLIVLVLLFAVIAAGVYLFVYLPQTQKSGPPVDTVSAEPVKEEPVRTTELKDEQTSSQEPSESAPTSPSLVVETKTLNLSPAEAVIPGSEKSSDPAIELMMAPRKLGADSAPIKVVEYSSLTCGHCSEFHKNDFEKIKADYIDTGKVQFIFKEFPLNKPALDASKILRCMPEDKFITFQALLFAEQEKWAYQKDYLLPLKQNAKLAGLSEEKIESCLQNQDLENRILGDMKAGSEKYKIRSTPTFVLNDGLKIIVGHQAMSVFQDSFNGILTETGPSSGEPSSAPEIKEQDDQKQK